MSSLTDLIFGPGNNPLMLGTQNAGNQAQQNPYVIQAQMGQTPQTQPTPGYVPGAQITDPSQAGPSLNPTQPNPQYGNLQNQLTTALSTQQGRDRAAALLQAGASMLSATDRYGRPARFGAALGAGLQGGMQGYQQEEQMANQQGRLALEAQNMGRQGALTQQQIQQGQQQLQMGQVQLDSAEYLKKMFGVGDVNTAKVIMAHNGAQAQLGTLQSIINDPNSPPDLKSRAQMLLPAAYTGTPIPNLGDQLLGKPESQGKQKLDAARTNAANATANYTNTMRTDLGSASIAKGYNSAADSFVKQMVAGSGTFDKAFGTNVDPNQAPLLANQLKARDHGGKGWPAGLPSFAKSQALPPGAVAHVNGKYAMWNGSVWIILKNAPPPNATPPMGTPDVSPDMTGMSVPSIGGPTSY